MRGNGHRPLDCTEKRRGWFYLPRRRVRLPASFPPARTKGDCGNGFLGLGSRPAISKALINKVGAPPMGSGLDLTVVGRGVARDTRSVNPGFTA